MQTVEGGVLIVQDVPVRVLASTEIERYAEPTIPEPPVCPLRSHAEMRAMSECAHTTVAGRMHVCTHCANTLRAQIVCFVAVR